MDSLDTRVPSLAALPLDPISPRLPIADPFTPTMAARAGIGRAVLDRLHREGRVRRLLRGVYVDATVPSSVDLRARALALVVGEAQVVVGLTAAWLHGVDLGLPGADSPAPVEVHGRGRAVSRNRGRPPRYADRDLQAFAGVRCTTPLRTALDLSRRLAPDRALAAIDGLLRLRQFTHTALMAEVARFGGQPGSVQLREIAALGDARAEGSAESVLRLRWLHGHLPTPTPALRVGPVSGHAVRLALGLEVHRFGAVMEGRSTAAALAAVEASGWRVVVLSPDRVLRSDPEFLTAHLEREFHLHLLDQVG